MWRASKNSRAARLSTRKVLFYDRRSAPPWALFLFQGARARDDRSTTYRSHAAVGQDLYGDQEHPAGKSLYTNQFVGLVKLTPAEWSEVEQRVKKELPSMRG